MLEPTNVDSSPVGQQPSVPAPQTPPSRSRFYTIIGSIMVIAAVGAYLYLFRSLAVTVPEEGADTQIADPSADSSASGEALFSFNLTKTAFAQYRADNDTIIPALPLQRAEVSKLDNLDAFKTTGVVFSDSQLKALDERGFFLAENDLIKEQTWGNDDFSDSYKNFGGSSNKYFREPDDALFISSDAALHFYHILIDRSFQQIEEEKFQPLLKRMTETLFLDSLDRYGKQTDPVLKASYARLAAYYLVPLVALDAAATSSDPLNPSDFPSYAQYLEAQAAAEALAGSAPFTFALAADEYRGRKIPVEVYDAAKTEVGLVAAAKGVAPSPLFTPYRPYFKNDYSQFKPRSHYTKNDILKSYFAAMMWYGRMGFSLDSDALTRDALAITGQINTLELDGRPLSAAYADLSSAIEFFVGQVDDLTPYEYSALAAKHFGPALTAAALADDEKLQGFIAAALKDLPLPRIVSEAVALYDNGGERDALLKQLMQFRFLGQRFTPDAYVLNNLTQGVGAPDPATGQNLPSMTTALMPIAVIAPQNTVVKEYVANWVSREAPKSDRIIPAQLAKLSAEFAGFDETVWTQNIYWSWLSSYRSLLSGYGAGYPYFMTTPDWQRKNLGTVLGSYTELKHDTLLYAKQSYAELGGGGEEPAIVPPVPKGYVEADPVFWARLNALARMTAAGLEERSLMPEYYGERFEKFVALSDFYRTLVRAELTGATISEDDYERLRQSGQVFDSLTAPLPGKELTDKDRRAGIIADIHTDAVQGEILYEATGKPYFLYVAVADPNGTRLTRGLAYRHYELTGPLSERYADEDWQKRVYSGEGGLPAEDDWSRAVKE